MSRRHLPNWNPADHPRGPGGRFIDKAFGDMTPLERKSYRRDLMAQIEEGGQAHPNMPLWNTPKLEERARAALGDRARIAPSSSRATQGIPGVQGADGIKGVEGIGASSKPVSRMTPGEKKAYRRQLMDEINAAGMGQPTQALWPTDRLERVAADARNAKVGGGEVTRDVSKMTPSEKKAYRRELMAEIRQNGAADPNMSLWNTEKLEAHAKASRKGSGGSGGTDTPGRASQAAPVAPKAPSDATPDQAPEVPPHLQAAIDAEKAKLADLQQKMKAHGYRNAPQPQRDEYDRQHDRVSGFLMAAEGRDLESQRASADRLEAAGRPEAVSQRRRVAAMEEALQIRDHGGKAAPAGHIPATHVDLLGMPKGAKVTDNLGREWTRKGDGLWHTTGDAKTRVGLGSSALAERHGPLTREAPAPAAPKPEKTRATFKPGDGPVAGLTAAADLKRFDNNPQAQGVLRDTAAKLRRGELTPDSAADRLEQHGKYNEVGPDQIAFKGLADMVRREAPATETAPLVSHPKLWHVTSSQAVADKIRGEGFKTGDHTGEFFSGDYFGRGVYLFTDKTDAEHFLAGQKAYVTPNAVMFEAHADVKNPFKIHANVDNGDEDDPFGLFVDSVRAAGINPGPIGQGAKARASWIEAATRMLKDRGYDGVEVTLPDGIRNGGIGGRQLLVFDSSKAKAGTPKLTAASMGKAVDNAVAAELPAHLSGKKLTPKQRKALNVDGSQSGRAGFLQRPGNINQMDRLGRFNGPEQDRIQEQATDLFVNRGLTEARSWELAISGMEDRRLAGLPAIDPSAKPPMEGPQWSGTVAQRLTRDVSGGKVGGSDTTPNGAAPVTKPSDLPGKAVSLRLPDGHKARDLGEKTYDGKTILTVFGSDGQPVAKLVKDIRETQLRGRVGNVSVGTTREKGWRVFGPDANIIGSSGGHFARGSAADALDYHNRNVKPHLDKIRGMSDAELDTQRAEMARMGNRVWTGWIDTEKRRRQAANGGDTPAAAPAAAAPAALPMGTDLVHNGKPATDKARDLSRVMADRDPATAGFYGKAERMGVDDWRTLPTEDREKARRMLNDRINARFGSRQSAAQSARALDTLNEAVKQAKIERAGGTPSRDYKMMTIRQLQNESATDPAAKAELDRRLGPKQIPTSSLSDLDAANQEADRLRSKNILTLGADELDAHIAEMEATLPRASGKQAAALRGRIVEAKSLQGAYRRTEANRSAGMSTEERFRGYSDEDLHLLRLSSDGDRQRKDAITAEINRRQAAKAAPAEMPDRYQRAEQRKQTRADQKAMGTEMVARQTVANAPWGDGQDAVELHVAKMAGGATKKAFRTGIINELNEAGKGSPNMPLWNTPKLIQHYLEHRRSGGGSPTTTAADRIATATPAMAKPEVPKPATRAKSAGIALESVKFGRGEDGKIIQRANDFGGVTIPIEVNGKHAGRLVTAKSGIHQIEVGSQRRQFDGRGMSTQDMGRTARRLILAEKHAASIRHRVPRDVAVVGMFDGTVHITGSRDIRRHEAELRDLGFNVRAELGPDGKPTSLVVHPADATPPAGKVDAPSRPDRQAMPGVREDEDGPVADTAAGPVRSGTVVNMAATGDAMVTGFSVHNGQTLVHLNTGSGPMKVKLDSVKTIKTPAPVDVGRMPTAAVERPRSRFLDRLQTEPLGGILRQEFEPIRSRLTDIHPTIGGRNVQINTARANRVKVNNLMDGLEDIAKKADAGDPSWREDLQRWMNRAGLDSVNAKRLNLMIEHAPGNPTKAPGSVAPQSPLDRLQVALADVDKVRAHRSEQYRKLSYLDYMKADVEIGKREGQALEAARNAIKEVHPNWGTYDYDLWAAAMLGDGFDRKVYARMEPNPQVWATIPPNKQRQFVDNLREIGNDYEWTDYRHEILSLADRLEAMTGKA